MHQPDEAPPAGFPVIALVSSVGGLAALRAVLGPLPASLPAALVAMQHTTPHTPSRLAALLQSHTALTVREAADGDALRPGTVLTVPAAAHLIVGTDARVRLLDTGRIPPARPSADLLLTTLAVALGPRVVAVVLTGGGTDAALGAQAVHAFGGRTVVQDEATAVDFSMPAAARDAHHPETPLPVQDIAAALVALLTR